ncbi:MAG: GNAT family N-acetyltransferase [Pseudomonadota bacterium]
MSFRVALAKPEDAADCAALLHEMDAFYAEETGRAAPLPTRATYEAEARRWMDEAEGTRLMLVRTRDDVRLGDGDGEGEGDDRRPGAPAAIACFAVLRPGQTLQGLVWLKDLYVARAHRRRGAGEAATRAVIAWARDHGIGRVDLTTGHDNAAARALYASLGGKELTDRLVVRFDAAAHAFD